MAVFFKSDLGPKKFPVAMSSARPLILIYHAVLRQLHRNGMAAHSAGLVLIQVLISFCIGCTIYKASCFLFLKVTAAFSLSSILSSDLQLIPTSQAGLKIIWYFSVLPRYSPSTPLPESQATDCPGMHCSSSQAGFIAAVLLPFAYALPLDSPSELIKNLTPRDLQSVVQGLPACNTKDTDPTWTVGVSHWKDDEGHSIGSDCDNNAGGDNHCWLVDFSPLGSSSYLFGK